MAYSSAFFSRERKRFYGNAASTHRPVVSRERIGRDVERLVLV